MRKSALFSTLTVSICMVILAREGLGVVRVNALRPLSTAVCEEEFAEFWLLDLRDSMGKVAVEAFVAPAFNVELAGNALGRWLLRRALGTLARLRGFGGGSLGWMLWHFTFFHMYIGNGSG